jgi:hypothetical protein
MIIERPVMVKTPVLGILERIMPAGLSRPRMRPSWFLVGLSLLAALQTATPVWVWGRLGHRVTSRLAELNSLDTTENLALNVEGDGRGVGDGKPTAARGG